MQEPLLTTHSIYLAFLIAICNNLRHIEKRTVEIVMTSFMRSSHWLCTKFQILIYCLINRLKIILFLSIYSIWQLPVQIKWQRHSSSVDQVLKTHFCKSPFVSFSVYCSYYIFYSYILKMFLPNDMVVFCFNICDVVVNS